MTLAQFDALATEYEAERERLDYRAALVSTVVANSHLGPGQKPYAVDDFMPRREPTVQTPEQQLALITVWNAAMGGTIEGR